MSIGEVCTREVVCIRRDATAAEAAQLMREFHVGTLVVAEETDGAVLPVGIVTDRDIAVGIVAARVDADVVLVGQIMGPALLTAHEGDDVYETIQVMRNEEIRRLPVVDDEGKLVGIVSQDDLYAHLSHEFVALTTVSGRQRLNEGAARAPARSPAMEDAYAYR